MSLRSSTSSLRPLCRICQRRQQQSLPPPSLFPPASLSTSRSISTTSPLNKRPPPGKPKRTYDLPSIKSKPNPLTHLLRPPSTTTTPKAYLPKTPPKPHQLLRVLLQRLPQWTASVRTRDRLAEYGFALGDGEKDLIDQTLQSWQEQVEKSLKNHRDDDDNSISSTMKQHGWDETDLLISMGEDDFGIALDRAYLRHFLTYCTTLSTIPETLRSHINSILRTTDLTRLPFEGKNIAARTLSRHFHLHVGPTNSGKTYNALKALSKAQRGAYAGPLRLLAHEVWERLNLGTVGDLNGVGRPCNLLTGEERRIVNPDAGLLSCTVEMLPLAGGGGGGQNDEGFDVVVIDEIQMLGDAQRGGAWTTAVLGVMAKEIHLCGDETTVDLLHSLIGTLGGDTVTVHRYDRLTPLTVADESLDSDFNKVEAGDCIVTFSRTNIFAVKRLVEAQAGKKCAVVYGALPPETRAEQARDFNDENGRAEVLVASDAVGMGLNLKIKRMVFESLHKFNGKMEVPLALTQIKQIAGRAGRYGLHKTPDPLAVVDSAESETEPKNEQAKAETETETETDPENVPLVAPDETPAPGGIVTTLHAADLPLLRQLLPLPLPPLPRAVLDIPPGGLRDLSTLLPSNITFQSLLDHYSTLAKTPSKTILNPQTHKYPLAEIVQPFADKLSLSEMDVFTFAPVSVRDPKGVSIFTRLVESYSTSGLVDLFDILEDSELLRQLHLVEITLKALPPLPTVLGIGKKPLAPPILISSIPLLETLHKSLVLYIWLSFRLPINFPNRTEAVDFKERTEIVLDSCLERLPGLRNKKNSERHREIESLWAREKRIKHLQMRETRSWKDWDQPLKVAKGVIWEGAGVLKNRLEG